MATVNPILDEVYAIRDTLARERGYDLKVIFDAAIQKQKISGHAVVSFAEQVVTPERCVERSPNFRL